MQAAGASSPPGKSDRPGTDAGALGPSPGTPAAIRLRGISKSFAGVQVLKDVSFEARPGRVLAIMGENGAGKSTLKNIMCGLLSPDTGTITVGGEDYSTLSSSVVREHGIAAVHQELSLFPNLGVAENMYVGMLPRDRFGNVRVKSIVPAAKKLLVESLGEALNPTAKVEHLSLGKRQMVEVAKALVRAREVLIFDEPTTSLSLAERARLLDAVRRVRDRGIGVIYISHFMEEVYEVADDIVVLRDGLLVASGEIKDMPRGEVEHHMVGRELEVTDHLPLPDSVRDAQPLLSVEAISDASLLREVSLQVRPGEILGVGGLLGAGRSELAQAIVGLRPVTGTVKVGDQALEANNPGQAREAGVVLVSEDRRGEQAFLDRPVRENLLVGHYSPTLRRFGLLSRRREAEVSDTMVGTFGVRLADVEQDMVSLSGGNQQKVILARWLDEKPRVCILDEPTKGIDVGAKAEVHRLVRELAAQGIAILLISSDMPELLALSHRIVVMHKGAAVGELSREEFEPDLILRLASTGARS
jgi:ABC-type sugar transport system ATPase subunit